MTHPRLMYKNLLCAIGFGPLMVEFCHRCGAVQPLDWYAHNELWARVQGGRPITLFRVLCPKCFERLARERNILIRWAPFDQEEWASRNSVLWKPGDAARIQEAYNALRLENQKLVRDVVDSKMALDDALSSVSDAPLADLRENIRILKVNYATALNDIGLRDAREKTFEAQLRSAADTVSNCSRNLAATRLLRRELSAECRNLRKQLAATRGVVTRLKNRITWGPRGKPK